MPRATSTTLLLGAILVFGSDALALTLPTTNFSCGLYTAPFFGSTLLSDCTAGGSAVPSTGGFDLVGVNLGMGGPVTWDVKGTAAGGTQIASPAPVETQGNALVLETSGVVDGSGTFTGYMPLHYDFTIAPVGAVSCLVSNPCTMDIRWSLTLLLKGPAVQGGEVGLPIATGFGTGKFSGDALLPSPPSPIIGVPPMTLTGGAGITVTGVLSLNASNFPNDASASFNVIVPAGASFDFQSANSEVPEPGTIALAAAGLLALVGRRLTSRS